MSAVPGSVPDEPMPRGLEVRGLSVLSSGARRGAARPLVDDVSFVAPPAALTALVGPNGAGKTTLLRALAGILPARSGELLFDGVDLAGLDRRARARAVAVVEQDATTELPLTGRAVAELGRTPHAEMFGRDARADETVDAALTRAGAEAFRDRDVTRLSGGERQRVLLARALAQEPRLLLLDEPTNHLDVSAQLDMLALVGELTAEGTTVVAALHDLTLAAAHAEAVVVLHHGKVVAAGPTAETLTPDLIARVYGIRAQWTRNPLTGRPLLAVARA